tara:strand:+ start:1677 stop:3113 length:1437 start_codon:yes stop_codon:yes gene_type:complete
MGFATTQTQRSQKIESKYYGQDTTMFFEALYAKLDNDQLKDFREAILTESYQTASSRASLTASSLKIKELETDITDNQNFLKDVKVTVPSYRFVDILEGGNFDPFNQTPGQLLTNWSNDNYSQDMNDLVNTFTTEETVYTYEEAINRIDALQKEIVKYHDGLSNIIKDGMDKGYITDATAGAGFTRTAGYGDAPQPFAYEIPNETGEYIQYGQGLMNKFGDAFISAMASEGVTDAAIANSLFHGENFYETYNGIMNEINGASVLNLGKELKLNNYPLEEFNVTEGGHFFNFLSDIGEGFADIRNSITNIFRDENTQLSAEIYNENILMEFTKIQWLLHQRQEILCQLEGGQHCAGTTNSGQVPGNDSIRDTFIQSSNVIASNLKEISDINDREELKISATLSQVNGMPISGSNYISLKDIYEQEQTILNEVIAQHEKKINDMDDIYQTSDSKKWLEQWKDNPDFTHKFFEEFIKEKYK